MTSREEFEKAVSDSPYERSVERWPNDPSRYSWPGNYKDINVDLAWCMWQESRRVALIPLPVIDGSLLGEGK